MITNNRAEVIRRENYYLIDGTDPQTSTIYQIYFKDILSSFLHSAHMSTDGTVVPLSDLQVLDSPLGERNGISY